MRRRSFIAGLSALALCALMAVGSAGAANRLLLLSGRVAPPCQLVGGVCVGTPGSTGIYIGHTLSWGDDFNSINIVGPTNPRGTYFTTRSYFNAGPRGTTAGALTTMYDTDPVHTGYLDSNQGAAVGFNNMSIAGSVLTLQARAATAGEQANFSPTSGSINGGVRDEASAMIHSAGAIMFYPASGASVIVEARMKYSLPATNPAGWHPTFWLFSGSPTPQVSGAGLGDEWDGCESNSSSCLSTHLAWNNGVSGASVSQNTFGLYDGNFHTVSWFLVNGASTILYIDGVAANTFALDSNTAGKLLYFLITSHVYNGTWLGENYSQAAWDSSGTDPTSGANIAVDWVRVWRPSTAKHWVPLQTIADLQVAYAGSGSIVLPSASSLWGDGAVTEYVQIIPDEVNEPGSPVTGYAQFPSGVSYNSGTRTISANFSGVGGYAGALHGVVYGYKTDGSTAQPARFTIYRGPNITQAGLYIQAGVPLNYNIYPACDVGIVTPKTMSMTGLPSGLTFNFVQASGNTPAVATVTGTPTVGGTASLTCTNNVGQTLTANFNFAAFGITYGGEAENNTAQTSYTFSNVPIAPLGASGHLVVAVFQRSAGSLGNSTVTIDTGDGNGAVAATAVEQQVTGSGPANYTGLFSRVIAGGSNATTANIVVAPSPSTAARCAVTTYSVVTAQSAVPSGAAIAVATLSGNDASASVTVPANGAAIAANTGIAGATTITAPASGITLDHSAVIGASTTVAASGHDTVTRTGATTYDFNSASSSAASSGVFAAWGP